MNPSEKGTLGEKIAENYLRKKGYKVLDRNFCPNFFVPKRGEIDIIVKKGDTISFVEVKTLFLNSVESNFLPEDRIDFAKKKRLIKMAEVWLNKNKIELNTKWQIDIIAIKIDKNSQKAKISHFTNAIC